MAEGPSTGCERSELGSVGNITGVRGYIFGNKYGKNDLGDSPFQCQSGELAIMVQDRHPLFFRHLYLTDPLSEGERKCEEPISRICGGLVACQVDFGETLYFHP